MNGVSCTMVELYKIHVEQIDRVRQRREGTSRVYVSLLSVCFASIGFLSRFGVGDEVEDLAMVLIALLGFTLSTSWLLHIRAYRQLNRHKFKMLHELEELHLPYRPLFRESEFQAEGQFTKLSTVEGIPPVLFGSLFTGLLIYLIA